MPQTAIYKLSHPELKGFCYIGTTTASDNPSFIKTSITAQHRHAIKKGEPRKEWFKLYENGLNSKELVLEVLETCDKKDVYNAKQKWYNQFYPPQKKQQEEEATIVNVPSVEISIVEPHEPIHSDDIVCKCDDYKTQLHHNNLKEHNYKTRIGKLEKEYDRLEKERTEMILTHKSEIEKLKRENEELVKKNNSQKIIIDDRYERIKHLLSENEELKKFRDEGFQREAFIAQLKYIISRYEKV
jgi:hypothetical protein